MKPTCLEPQFKSILACPCKLPSNLATRDTPAIWPAAMCKSEWHTPQYFISINLGRQWSVEDPHKHRKENRKTLKTWCWYLVHISYDVYYTLCNIYIKCNSLNQEPLNPWNLSNTSRSLNSLLWSFMGSNEHVSSLHPMQIVSMALLTWLCDELAGWKRVISGKAAADFQWWNLAGWNEERETTVCYLLLLLGASESWEIVILGIQTTILDLKLNVEVQKNHLFQKWTYALWLVISNVQN